MIMSGANFTTCSCSASFVSTLIEEKSNPLFFNSWTASSLSASTSSKNNIFSGFSDFITRLNCQFLIKQNPVVTYFYYCFGELIKVHRFYYVAVNSQPIAFHNISFFL